MKQIKTFEQFINEESLGFIKHEFGNFELFKDPGSLTEFPDNARGIIVENEHGEFDFYITKTNKLIHDAIIRLVRSKGYIKDFARIEYINNKPKEYKILTVQRPGNENKVYVGGSIEDDTFIKYESWIKKAMTGSQQKNKDIEFIPEKIDPKYDIVYTETPKTDTPLNLNAFR